MKRWLAAVVREVIRRLGMRDADDTKERRKKYNSHVKSIAHGE
jgi:hypothetical protein